VTTGGDVVYGLRAAAKLTGWSASGIQKLVDAGKVPAERDGRTYMFRVVDLEAIRRSPGQPQPSGFPTTAAPASFAGPSAETPADATTPVGGRPEIAAPANAVQSSASANDDGIVASVIFTDLAAGRTLVQIVAERKIAPDVVQQHHQQWRELKAFDDAQTPTALDRLGQVEAELALRARQVELQALDERVAGIESAVHEVSTAATRDRQNLETHLAGLERKVRTASGGSATTDALQRLAALEALVRSLPMALVPAAHRCPRCGNGQLATPAACAGCGFGLGPPSA
jgi:hypothetical protein